MKIGTQLSMTLDWASPSAWPRKPSWNTATMTPYAAAVDSRLSAIALIGITIEWKATSSSRNDSPRTNANTSGMRVGIDLRDVHGAGRVAGDVAPGRPGSEPNTAGTTGERISRTVAWSAGSFCSPAMVNDTSGDRPVVRRDDLDRPAQPGDRQAGGLEAPRSRPSRRRGRSR